MQYEHSWTHREHEDGSFPWLRKWYFADPAERFFWRGNVGGDWMDYRGGICDRPWLLPCAPCIIPFKMYCVAGRSRPPTGWDAGRLPELHTPEAEERTSRLRRELAARFLIDGGEEIVWVGGPRRTVGEQRRAWFSPFNLAEYHHPRNMQRGGKARRNNGLLEEGPHGWENTHVYVVTNWRVFVLRNVHNDYAHVHWPTLLVSRAFNDLPGLRLDDAGRNIYFGEPGCGQELRQKGCCDRGLMLTPPAEAREWARHGVGFLDMEPEDAAAAMHVIGEQTALAAENDYYTAAQVPSPVDFDGGESLEFIEWLLEERKKRKKKGKRGKRRDSSSDDDDDDANGRVNAANARAEALEAELRVQRLEAELAKARQEVQDAALPQGVVVAQPLAAAAVADVEMPVAQPL